MLLVTGSYPPEPCGVGDYTHHLAKALAGVEGLDVAVLTTREDRPPVELPGVKVYPEVPRWTLGSARLVRRIVAEHRPDLVHVQYPTQGYDGMLAGLLPALLKLRGARVVQTWHEYFASGLLKGVFKVFACDGLVYVRADLAERLPGWVRRSLSSTPMAFVPNATTIPPVALGADEVRALRASLSPDRSIVCYFGFPYPHKGVDRLFEIADPAKHHLLLICDLDRGNEYQAGILSRAQEPRWAGRVTVTGFQPARKVGEFLAVADAVVFPFPGGAGSWNTSLKAAEASGAFTLATSADPGLRGLQPGTNTFYAACDDLAGLKEALAVHAGRRIAPRLEDPWRDIALAHERLYRRVLEGRRADAGA